MDLSSRDETIVLVLKAVQPRGLNINEIMTATDQCEQTIRKHVLYLQGLGLIERVGKCWRLKDAGK
jgi:predicted transcriptional regulator